MILDPGVIYAKYPIDSIRILFSLDPLVAISFSYRDRFWPCRKFLRLTDFRQGHPDSVLMSFWVFWHEDYQIY